MRIQIVNLHSGNSKFTLEKASAAMNCNVQQIPATNLEPCDPHAEIRSTTDLMPTKRHLPLGTAQSSSTLTVSASYLASLVRQRLLSQNFHQIQPTPLSSRFNQWNTQTCVCVPTGQGTALFVSMCPSTAANRTFEAVFRFQQAVFISSWIQEKCDDVDRKETP